MYRLVSICIALILAAAPEASAAPLEPVRGPARVIDADTLEVAGERVRLHGIDAPERSQTCRLGVTETPCGRHATEALRARLHGREVICRPRDRDRYGRLVAVCEAGGEDVNRWLVREGWAAAYRRYSHDYVADEQRARAARRGLWAGDFQPPEDWRRARRPRG